jgi:hypothetical protein
MAILIQMWHQVMHSAKYVSVELMKYYALPIKIMTINNYLSESLIHAVTNNLFTQHGDDMVKKRVGKSLRQSDRASMYESGKEFKYLSSICENEITSSL